MARRYGKKRKHSRMKPSLVSMAPIAVLGLRAYQGYSAGGFKDAVGYPLKSVSGFSLSSGKWEPDANTMAFYGTIAGTYVAKKVIGMTGVNKAMKGLPFRL